MSAYDRWKTTDPSLEDPFLDGCPECGGGVFFEDGRGWYRASCNDCDWRIEDCAD